MANLNIKQILGRLKTWIEGHFISTDSIVLPPDQSQIELKNSPGTRMNSSTRESISQVSKFGLPAVSNGSCSAAFGRSVALGSFSFAEGGKTGSVSTYSVYAEGTGKTLTIYNDAAGTQPVGNSSLWENIQNRFSIVYRGDGVGPVVIITASDQNNSTITTNVALGNLTESKLVYIYSDRNSTNSTSSLGALGDFSHSEGGSTLASGDYSHSEGVLTFASGEGSHAEGVSEGPRTEVQRDWMWDIMKSATTESRLYQTLSDNTASELYGTGWRLWKIAIGDSPVLPGSEDSSEWEDVYDQNITITSVYTGTSKWIQLSKKLGIGNKTTFGAIFIESEEEVEIFPTVGALGMGSHVEGISTIAENTGEHAEGKYNVSNTGTIHSVGIGTADNARKNAFEIMQNGDAYLIGIGGYDGTTITNATPLQSSIAQKAASSVISLSSSDSDTDVFIGPYQTNANYIFVLENVGQPVTYIGFITDGNEGGNSFDVKGNIPPEIRYDKVVCNNGDCYCRINYHNIPQYEFSTNVTVTNLLGDYVEILGSINNVTNSYSGYYSKSYFNGVAVPGVISQTQTWSGSGANPRTYTMENKIYGPIPKANIDLFESSGAIFNEETGYFELNSLLDISYEEMKTIYSFPIVSKEIGAKYLGARIRTTITQMGGANSSNGGAQFSMGNAFNTSYVEVVSLVNSHTSGIRGASMGTAFRNAYYLRKILDLIRLDLDNPYMNQDFTGCYSLEYVHIKSNGKNIELPDSPILAEESLLYMINNAGTNNFTITLHPSVYAKCQSGGDWFSDVDSALQSHTNVQIASA